MYVGNVKAVLATLVEGAGVAYVLLSGGAYSAGSEEDAAMVL